MSAVECDDNEKQRSEDHQVHYYPSVIKSLNSGENHWNDEDGDDQLAVPFEELEYHASMLDRTDASAFQSEQPLYPMSREELFKRCQWFDDIEEPVGANAASPPSQSNRLKLAPKQIYQRVKSRRQKSPTPVAPIGSLTVEECDFDFCPDQRPDASRKINQTLIEVCLPPGCIPSNVIVQVNREESQSETEARATIQNDGVHDLWMDDICHQALTLENFDEPGAIAASNVSGVTVVHDLEEESLPEGSHLACRMFKGFLQSLTASFRRNAICEELEMVTGLVKINGARFNLWHLRKELLKTLKTRKG